MLPANQLPIARFGLFEAELRTGELRKAGKKLRIQDQPFRVLTALLDQPGQLVTRDELKERIWPDDTLIDFDHALTTAVKKLRRALQDSANQPRYIETLPKRGYRFIAPVEWLSEDGGGRPQDEDANEEDSGPSLAWQRNAFAGLSAGLLAIMGLLFWTWPEPPERHGRHYTITPELSPGDFWGGPQNHPAAISPDGRNIVLAGGRPRRALWIRELARTGLRMLPGTEGASSPFWSPDSEFVAFGSGSTLKVVSIYGGAPRDLAPISGGMFAGGAWSPDGETIVFSTGTPPTLYRIPAGGGTPERLFEAVATEGGGANYDVSFLPPDVRKETILFMSGGPANRQMVARDLRTGRQTMLGSGLRPVYSRSGFIVYQAFGQEGGLWALPFDPSRMEPLGAAEPLVDGVVEPSLAHDDTLVFLDLNRNQSNQKLVLRDRSGELLDESEDLSGIVNAPVFSPDQLRVAVELDQTGERDIWIVDVAARSRSRLTFDPAVEADPVWSPDGTKMVYRSARTAETELLLVEIAGRGQAEVLPARGLAKRATDWSNDGRYIVYSASEPGTLTDLWLLEFGRGDSPDQVRPLLQTPTEELDGQISPDGRFLAYCSDETGRFEVYVTQFPEPRDHWQVSRGGGCQPRWVRDGAEMIYVSGRRLFAAQVGSSFEAEFQVGASEELFRDGNLASTFPTRATYDVTADGDRFVLRQTRRETAETPVALHVVENWPAVFAGRLSAQTRPDRLP